MVRQRFAKPSRTAEFEIPVLTLISRAAPTSAGRPRAPPATTERPAPAARPRRRLSRTAHGCARGPEQQRRRRRDSRTLDDLQAVWRFSKPLRFDQLGHFPRYPARGIVPCSAAHVNAVARAGRRSGEARPDSCYCRGRVDPPRWPHPRRSPPGRDPHRLPPQRRGVRALPRRGHGRPVHRVRRRERAPLDGRQGQGLADGRVPDAPAREPRAARGPRRARQAAERPDAGDPAPDRPRAPGRGGPRPARRAHPRDRLRRARGPTGGTRTQRPSPAASSRRSRSRSIACGRAAR